MRAEALGEKKTQREESEREETRRKLQAGPLLAVQAEEQRDWVRGSRAVERACQVLQDRYVTRPQKVGGQPGTSQVLDRRLRLFDAQISMAQLRAQPMAAWLVLGRTRFSPKHDGLKAIARQWFYAGCFGLS